MKSLESESGDKDDMVLLNEILNASSLDEGEFSKEWTAVFGQVALADLSTNSSAGDVENMASSVAPTPSGYLPSQLLDQNMNDLQSSLHGESSSCFAGVLVLGIRVWLSATWRCGDSSCCTIATETLSRVWPGEKRVSSISGFLALPIQCL